MLDFQVLARHHSPPHTFTDPNLEDWMDFDRTALHYASMFGSLEAVVWLVEEAGADPSVEDSTRATPLALAEQRGRPEGNTLTLLTVCVCVCAL